MFSQGKPVIALHSKATAPPWVILARAQAGQHPVYSWVTFNCEHFVSFALGAPIKSPQIAFWGLAAAALFVIGR